MSASLVGSEMCIRDSAEPAPELETMASMGGSACAQPLGHGSRAPEAVSYTHLTLPTICSV
eukprot:13901913-Alexandrium_andersonii.AAC.1